MHDVKAGFLGGLIALFVSWGGFMFFTPALAQTFHDRHLGNVTVTGDLGVVGDLNLTKGISLKWPNRSISMGAGNYTLTGMSPGEYVDFGGCGAGDSLIGIASAGISAGDSILVEFANSVTATGCNVVNQSASATAADRIVTPHGVTWIMGSNEQATFVYRDSRWYMMPGATRWPLTTPGDIILMDSSAVQERLPIGTAGQHLTVTGNVPTWSTFTDTDTAIEEFCYASSLVANDVLTGSFQALNLTSNFVRGMSYDAVTDDECDMNSNGDVLLLGFAEFETQLLTVATYKGILTFGLNGVAQTTHSSSFTHEFDDDTYEVTLVAMGVRNVTSTDGISLEAKEEAGSSALEINSAGLLVLMINDN